MSKQSGLGFNLYVGGVDVSGDIGSLGKVAGPQVTIDMTGIDKFAHERQVGGRSGEIDFSSFFDAATAHPVFSALPTADQMVTLACGVTARGLPGAVMTGKQIGYDPTRGNDGSLACAVSAMSNSYGLEWGVQLTTGKQSDTTATNSPGVDLVAATAFGWQAYLQVFAFTGSSVLVSLQDSPDDVTYTNLTGGAFSVVTGVTTQRLEGARNAAVARYVRVVTSGTFSLATFNVVFVKNQTDVTF